MATEMRDTCDLDVMTEHQIFTQCLWVNVTCAADQAAPSAEAHSVSSKANMCEGDRFLLCDSYEKEFRWKHPGLFVQKLHKFWETYPKLFFRNWTEFVSEKNFY